MTRSMTDRAIRRQLGHNGVECRVRITREGQILRHGSPVPTDRSLDYWQDMGHVDEMRPCYVDDLIPGLRVEVEYAPDATAYDACAEYGPAVKRRLREVARELGRRLGRRYVVTLDLHRNRHMSGGPTVSLVRRGDGLDRQYDVREEVEAAHLAAWDHCEERWARTRWARTRRAQ